MMKNKRSLVFGLWSLVCLCVFAVNFFAQETPPAPSAPKSVKIPTIKAKTLPNKLQVVVVERKNVPLVTVQLLVKAGAETEGAA